MTGAGALFLDSLRVIVGLTSLPGARAFRFRNLVADPFLVLDPGFEDVRLDEPCGACAVPVRADRR